MRQALAERLNFLRAPETEAAQFHRARCSPLLDQEIPVAAANADAPVRRDDLFEAQEFRVGTFFFDITHADTSVHWCPGRSASLVGK